jgi:hydroxyethylthiazole kinase
MIDSRAVAPLVARVKEKSPLVHNITNYVVMNFTANALLSMGASPVMAHAVEEVEDMTSISNALVVNIGTLSRQWVDGMVMAMKRAWTLDKPIVLDPVGVGSTPYRAEVARYLLKEGKPTVIRGNASEILALHQSLRQTKGVDSVNTSEEALSSARALARQYDCVVCVSGATDYIVNDAETVAVHNGHRMMTMVTGLGCAATALIGAFMAVEAAPILATAGAMTAMGIAGAQAAELSRGPGGFQAAFLDSLYQLNTDTMIRIGRVETL